MKLISKYTLNAYVKIQEIGTQNPAGIYLFIINNGTPE